MSGGTSYDKLARSLFYRGQPLIMVAGAGLSMSAGIPTPYRIMEHLVQSLEGLVPAGELRDFLARSTPQEAFELYAQQLGERRLVVALQKLMPPDLAPSPLHRALAQVPASLFVTTNYDSLIESSLEAVGRSFVSISSDSDMKKIAKGAVSVLHLRGILTQPNTVSWGHGGPESRDTSAIDRYLRVAFSGHTAVFIGMSVSSPDFAGLYQSYRGFGRNTDTLWIAVTNRSNSLERDLWISRGVRQIEVPHDELSTFLGAIHDQVETLGQQSGSPIGRRVLMLGELPPATFRGLHQRLAATGVELIRPDRHDAAIPVINNLLELSRDVTGAVVLLDGRREQHQRSPSREPRSNISFELGLLVGRLGLGKVVVVSTGRERLPSDFGGLTYLFVDDPRPSRIADAIVKWIEEAV